MSRLNLTRRRFKPLLEEIGLDASKYSLYTLRHTCATLSLAAGANIKAVAEKLGHADVNMLLTVYAHVLPSMRAEATEKLGNVLYPKGPVRKAA
jgi:integrase